MRRFFLRPAVLLSIAVPLLFALLTPLTVRGVFIDMPAASKTFDCDDGALFMKNRLSQLGISSTSILGNLKQDGETFSQSDHVWVIANILGLRVPLDWGDISWDRQHFEGHPLTNDQLLAFVQQDFDERGIPSANP